AALTPLETSVAPEGSSSSWFAAVLGWATYRDQVVRVLEPTVYYRLAESALDEAWAGRRDKYRDGFSSNRREPMLDMKSSPSNHRQTTTTTGSVTGKV